MASTRVVTLLQSDHGLGSTAGEALDLRAPMIFRQVGVDPQAMVLTGLPMRPDKCGAIVINTLRR